MANKIRLDNRGIGEVLDSAPVYAEVQRLASSVKGTISATAGGETIPVTLRTRVAAGGRLRSPRRAIDVTLAHPAGLRVEALRGPLARGAASAGLQMKKMGG